MRSPAALLLAMIATAAFAQDPNARRAPAEVTVRIFSIHPPAEARLVPNPAFEWRGCASCPPQAATGELKLLPRAGSVLVGNAQHASFAISGHYTLLVAGAPPVESAYPLEVSADAASRGLKLVMRFPLEDYVAAVLAGESAGLRSDEAMKAMAVAARTYAVRFRDRHEGFDFCDSTHCQDIRLTQISGRVRAAAQATAGELVWFRGAPAATFYHRSCGGITESAGALWSNQAAPYLRSHSDPYCQAQRREEWSTALSRDDLAHALGLDAVHQLRVATRTRSGRAATLAIDDGAPMRAAELRFSVGRALGWNQIRSDLYEVSADASGFVFRGRGAGHGVGLCQLGADAMGTEGKTYREILAFYYPGTAVSRTAQNIAWTALTDGRLQLFTSAPDLDGNILSAGTRALRELEHATGFAQQRDIRLRAFASTQAFRDATAEPGWLAASTRGDDIRLQPQEVLRRSGGVDATVRHELLHVLLRQNALVTLPLWFEEGLVVELTSAPTAGARCSGDAAALTRSLQQPASREEMQSAYARAQACVHVLLESRGRTAVLGWVRTRVPPDAFASAAGGAAHD